MMASPIVESPAVAAAASPYVDEVVAGWRSSAVYVHPSQRALVSDVEADRLAARVGGRTPEVRIAVVPAAALAGGDRNAAARAFVDAVVDAQRADGVYLVVFGGAMTWGSAVGVDVPVAEALADELPRHSRSDPVGLLNGVLSRIDVPEADDEGSGSSWVWPVLLAVLALGVLGLGLRWWRSRRTADEGPALYKPSYDVLPDEVDTLAERQQAAREDVTRFGEELDAADLPVGRPEVAAHAQAAMDAYAEAGREVDGEADGEPDDDRLRGVRATVEYGRWRLASAQAVLAGTPAPPRRAACFFDPAHGISVTDWMYTPTGGRAREIPVCAACRDRLRGGAR